MTKSSKNESKKVSGGDLTPEKKTNKAVSHRAHNKDNNKTVSELKEGNTSEKLQTVTSKKIVSADELGAETSSNAEHKIKHEDKVSKESAAKSSTENVAENIQKNSLKSRESKNFIKRLLVTLTAIATLLVLIAGGAWIWILGTPEYAYYRMYTAAKEKNYDKFMEYVDSTSTAEDLVSQESDYLKQNNINDIQAKFSIKGTLEYTFYQYIDSGNLVQILPYQADNAWKLFENKDLSKDKNSFTINLKTEPKLNNTEGIFGYKKIVFKLKGNKWVISQLQDNPSLEQSKKDGQKQK